MAAIPNAKRVFGSICYSAPADLARFAGLATELSWGCRPVFAWNVYKQPAAAPSTLLFELDA